jgi:hypothetical protein
MRFTNIYVLIACVFLCPNLQAQSSATKDSIERQSLPLQQINYFDLGIGLLSGFNSIKIAPAYHFNVHQHIGLSVGINGIFAANGALTGNKGYAGVHAAINTFWQTNKSQQTPNWLYLELQPELNFAFSSSSQPGVPSLLMSIGDNIYSIRRRIGIGAKLAYDLLRNQSAPYAFSSGLVYQFSLLVEL